MGKPFQAGDTCLMVDSKGRHYLITLEEGGTFHYHAGVVAHSMIIGHPEGVALRSSSDSRLVALRPRLADYILRMERGPQIVYPKDIGPILMWSDIGPGMTVVEGGTGSGALTMALVRAVGPTGRVISVDRRDDHAEHARRMIEGYFGEIPPNLELHVGEVVEAIGRTSPDRIVLDLPAPWEVVDGAMEALAAGGVFCCFLPTVPQVQRIHEALRLTGSVDEVTTFEVLLREWSAEGRSVRPEHHMVGHTGFITVARKVEVR